MALIVRDALNKDHFAPVLSKTGFVSIIFIAITFILPLYLVVMTHNYWLHTYTYEE